MSNEEKQTRKTLKKAYNITRRKTVSPFKGLTILLAILTLVCFGLNAALTVFDNTAAAFMGGTFWKLVNPDANAQYFTSDFASPEDMVAYGLELCRLEEAEGAALLMNENAALPLGSGAKVSLFSSSSANLVYGGTGSGNIDASSADNLKTALEKEGIQVNDTLWKFYTEGEGKKYTRAGGGMVSLTSASVAEVPWSVYTDEVKSSVSAFGDAAVVVLSRVGGEGADLEYTDLNYLALDPNEKDMMAAVSAMKQAGTVKKIVVLINSANALQVDFLKNNEYGVDACLWIGDVGITGINAVAQILSGAVNPSGSLVDTYCFDNYSSPAMRNFTPITYGGDTSRIPGTADTYMIYQEGIYVGYKYYETRYEDFVMGTGNAGAYDYASEVAFPFGYGLSYTTFGWSGYSCVYNAAADRFDISLTVTNTGSAAGKQAVKIFAQSPYTDYDVATGVEKASVALCGFGKTGILKPGQSETLKITVDRRDLASFDAYGAGTYILDAGDYYLTAAADAHSAVNNILAAKGYTPAGGRMDAPGDAAMVGTWNNPSMDTVSYSVSVNGTPITNRLSDADINMYTGSNQSVVYLTRNDWTGTFPTEPVRLELTDTMVKDLQLVRYNPALYNTVPMPTTGAAGSMTLYQMIGKAYDDPDWEKLLDQVTFDEMVALIGDSFHWTMPVVSVQAPGTRDENGPQGLTASLFGSGAAKLQATAFTSEDVMAATFNREIMTEIGKVIGNNCLAAEVACLYGPGSNIHRTPYGGRNFEYYSEDGYLSGEMSRCEIDAIQAKGVHVVTKHFALNDSEQDRLGLGVWIGEQAAREIYLKAFQAPFELGDANGVMIAYTRWGCVWSGGNQGLVNGILRGEWGCDGLIITDNVITDFVVGADGVLAGVSTYDAMMPNILNQLPAYREDPVIVTAMREATHHNLYAIANSCGMNGVGAKTTVKAVTPGILTTLRVASCVFGLLFVVCLVFWVIRAAKFRKTSEYAAWKAYRKNQKK